MTGPRKVVLAPDILVAALFDQRAREILNQWRDGQLQPVVTRELLVLYLRTLRQAGLTAELVRKWSLWLTAGDKTLYLENMSPNPHPRRDEFRESRESSSLRPATGLALCREIAAAAGAELLAMPAAKS